jgi:hypothetical protein
MYCMKCESERPEGYRFCVICGTPLTEPPVIEVEPEPTVTEVGLADPVPVAAVETETYEEDQVDSAYDPVKSDFEYVTETGATGQEVSQRKSKWRPLLAFGILVLILATGFGVFLLQKPASGMLLSISMSATSGGLFDKNCVPTADAEAMGIREVVVTGYGEGVKSGVKTNVTFSSTPHGCVAQTNVSLAKHQDFDLYVSGEKVGFIPASDVSSGSSNQKATFTVFKKFSGSAVLSDRFLGCSTVEKVGIGCTVPSNAQIGADLHFNKMTCSGIAGDSDIQRGAILEVHGVESGTVTKVSLGAGRAEMAKPSTGELKCSFSVAETSLPFDSKGYSFKVGNHTSTFVSLETLGKSNWSYAVPLN